MKGKFKKRLQIWVQSEKTQDIWYYINYVGLRAINCKILQNLETYCHGNYFKHFKLQILSISSKN